LFRRNGSSAAPLVPAEAGTQGPKNWIPTYGGMSGLKGARGFTLIEVLVALSVVAISLAAIGSLIAVTTRGARAVGLHLTLVETARSIITGLPDRDQLALGNMSGESASHRWRVDVLPFYADFVDPRDPTVWTPQTVVVRVESPSGKVLQVNTVRLRRKSNP
jgi:general secretion pathway protein I